MGERKRETEKEGEREIERRGKVPEKWMCQNCMPAMNVNTLCSAPMKDCYSKF